MFACVCWGDKGRHSASAFASLSSTSRPTGSEHERDMQSISGQICCRVRYPCTLGQFGLVAVIDKLSASQETPVSLEALKDALQGQ